MKTLHTFLLILLPTVLFSQTFTEKIGAISTDYKIVSNSNRLNVIDQIIVKRGLSNSQYESSYQYGYGYGLQTYRLEFITTDVLETIGGNNGIGGFFYGKEYNKESRYNIEFYDASNSKILKTSLDVNDVLIYSNGENLNIYSINLQKIPLIVLNKTQEIKITIIK